jgi:hypothetical protein
MKGILKLVQVVAASESKLHLGSILTRVSGGCLQHGQLRIEAHHLSRLGRKGRRQKSRSATEIKDGIIPGQLRDQDDPFDQFVRITAAAN